MRRAEHYRSPSQEATPCDSSGEDMPTGAYAEATNQVPRNGHSENTMSLFRNKKLLFMFLYLSAQSILSVIGVLFGMAMLPPDSTSGLNDYKNDLKRVKSINTEPTLIKVPIDQ
jgi:hypothetical protein